IAQMSRGGIRIERCDEHGSGAASGKLGDGLRLISPEFTADMAYILDEDSSNLGSIQREERVECREEIVRIVNRHRPACPQLRQQRARRLRRQGMRDRLVEGVAADGV